MGSAMATNRAGTGTADRHRDSHRASHGSATHVRDPDTARVHGGGQHTGNQQRAGQPSGTAPVNAADGPVRAAVNDRDRAADPSADDSTPDFGSSSPATIDCRPKPDRLSDYD